ncbi:MAG: family 1 glycosylhydrolase [Acidimicrobiales bacterium]|nr:family 1 glycosylhydrolase [Acidimicrobiales bacterium]
MSSPTAEFRWGVTSSSVSAEGVSPYADWSEWESDGRAPRSGDGFGLHEDFRDDVAQFAELGCTDWRVTIEWARIEPEEGRLDSDALDRYRDILAAARDAGLRNWLTLQHTSLPGWYLDDEGGHRDAGARGRFWARHVDRVAEELDEFADGFVPIDDPIGWALRGYGLGTRPPGRTDPRWMREAVEGAILAVHDAVRLLSSGRQSVMTTWRADPVHARAEEDGRIPVEAEQATRRWDDLLWGTWLRAHANGMLEIEGRPTTEVPAFVNEVDIVGIVHDHPIGVGPQGALGPWPPDARRAADGFAPEPDELAEAIHRTVETLPDHSIAVAGHGIATTDDAWQDDQLARGLAHVREAAADVGLCGYFHDAGVDGYEWKKGFDAPRGLLRRDRSHRPAAATFRDAARG